MIASLIEHEDISILNTGEPTHFQVQTGTFSMIDLSICSSNCYLDFAWRVNEDRHTSDHFPIIITIDDSIPAPRSPRWCLERVDWTRFKSLTAIETEAKDMPIINDAISLILLSYSSCCIISYSPHNWQIPLQTSTMVEYGLPNISQSNESSIY